MLMTIVRLVGLAMITQSLVVTIIITAPLGHKICLERHQMNTK
ncbi:hypothetical protein Hanom_Chr02g00142281 [Helianthus anomalus]